MTGSVAALTAFVVAAVLGLAAGPPAAAGVDAGSPDGGALARYYEQTLTWHGCRADSDDDVGTALDAASAQCADVTVPLDYARPAGRTITVAVARHKAADTAHRLGTLLVNTGGPGPSRDGVLAVLQGLPPVIPHGSPAVAARYDLVGMDPRFFGRSTPLECGWPAGAAMSSANVAAPDRRSFDRSVALAKDLAGRCADHRDLLPYASTRNVARDADVVRAALGEQRISYLGWSYGTYLGAVYLQMFPGRADRTVLDSAVDPAVYAPDLNRATGAKADAEGLRDWAGWAARRHGRYGLGASTEQVLATVERIRLAAGRRPLRVGDHEVTAAMLPGLLLTVVDTDEAYAEFSTKVGVLSDAARGGTATPTPELDEYLTLLASTDVVPAFGFSAGLALRCADRAASRATETYWRDIRAHRGDEPLYGPLTRNITPCAFWATAPAEPPTEVHNDARVLMIGADGDPAAPYPGQLALHHALTGSRLVTLRGAYRHGVYLFDANPCVDGTVDHYLLDGVLPTADTHCIRP
ncbi:alpha/beta hydrolase [Longispora urticae]